MKRGAESKTMSDHLGWLDSYVKRHPLPECTHPVFDENAVARVCLSCKRVLQVKPPPLP